MADSMNDSIGQLCIAISNLHTAIEKIARETCVDVDGLLQASDCITAQVLVTRYAPFFNRSGLKAPRVERSPWRDNRKPRRAVHLTIVK